MSDRISLSRLSLLAMANRVVEERRITENSRLTMMVSAQDSETLGGNADLDSCRAE